MIKDLEISRLCDAYGALLTDNMLRAVRDYYDYDMSLAEIAAEFGISRQAVMCRLRQAESKLREFEDAIGLVKRTDRLESELRALTDKLGDEDGDARAAAERMIDGLKDGRY